MIVNALRSFAKKSALLRRIFTSKTSSEYEGFITLDNTLANKKIFMYLRKDSYMEKEFRDKGLFGEWEKESLKIWAELCKSSSNILDIGANTGVFSLIAKSQNKAARVFSVEPIDVNFNILSKNIKKNKFDINAEQVALSSADGVAKMFMLKDRLNFMTSVNDNRYEKHPEITGTTEIVEVQVPTKTYQYLKDKYNILKLDLIKIDVEGHEVAVLKAMLPDIKKDLPVILLEVIGEENGKQLNQMFAGFGYKIISINEVNKAVVVNEMWDNDHHNFLLCSEAIVKQLQLKNLVE